MSNSKTRMRNVLFLILLIQLFISLAITRLGSVEYGLLFELSQCVDPNGPSNQMVICTEFGNVIQWLDVFRPAGKHPYLNALSIITDRQISMYIQK